MKRIIKKVFLIILITLFIGEIVGRYFGLHQYPTHISSKKFEYIHAPSQDRFIYRNKFSTNEFSMRSNPITEKDTSVVLLIGDSVINGGTLTDQDNLASTILEHILSKNLNQSIRVLNISASSWGPDNAAEYIKEYGLFDADAIILVVSSHDAYDNMTHVEIVNKHPQFFTENYKLALGNLMERAWYKLKQSILNKNNPRKTKNADLMINQAKIFNVGFEYFKNLTVQQDIPFVIYLHPTLKEFNTQTINDNGKKIIEFANQNDIDIIEELHTSLKAEHYRDHIHYSEKGQNHLAKNLLPKITHLIEKYGTQQNAKQQ